MIIRIDNFPSFVASKADEYITKRITTNGTKWYVKVGLYNYCQAGKEYVPITSSSMPEFFGAFLCGIRTDQKECSFAVEAIFKFKRPSTAREIRYSHKFVFKSTNQHYDSWGCPAFVRIDVIFLLYH